MTAKILSDHAFILWSQQVGLLHVYMLAIKQMFVLMSYLVFWKTYFWALKGLEFCSAQDVRTLVCRRQILTTKALRVKVFLMSVDP